MAFAQSPEEKGLEIAKEADRRDTGWETSETVLKMLLRNRHGETSTRELRTQTLENTNPDEGDKSLIVFSFPRDVNGTALLSHTKILDPDDQWLYLPALKRVKRISSKNKSGPFVGSEFAFEDLVSQEAARYTYKWLRDETLNDMPCFVIERYPRYENSGYTKQIVWIDTAEYRLMKIDYYDRKDSLLKTLVLEDYRQYLERYWRSHRMTMKNHQTGKSTLLTFSEFSFGIGLTETDFTAARLKQIR